MTARLLGPADYVSMPWSNGLGTTIEMAREDEGPNRMLWRLSRAMVTKDGAFSFFPHMDRTLMLLDGPGLTLDFGDFGGIRLEAPFEVATFSGSWKTHAREVTGTCLDLNLMVAHDRAWATVKAHQNGGFRGRSNHRSLLLAWGGTWHVTFGGSPFTLPDQHLLLLEGEPGFRLIAQGTGTLIELVIELTPSRPAEIRRLPTRFSL